MHRPVLRHFTTLACLALSACGQADREQRAADSAQQAHIAEVVAAGGVVDSILPIEEHLRRFRAELPRIDTLRGSSASRDILVERFARAVGARDTTALNAMVIDRAEFAWLYYPGSAMSRPPYEAPPELLWGQIGASSNAGLRKLLDRYAHPGLRVAAIDCPAATVDGANRLHERCTVRLEAPGMPPVTGTLFGTILERDGRFKFLSFANRI